MPNKQVLDYLRSHCGEILGKAAELGLTNVKVYQSSFSGYKNKFCCTVDIQQDKETEISYIELGEFIEYLENTLHCEVLASFSDDDNIDKEGIAQAIPLSKKKLEKISELFLPVAKGVTPEKKNHTHHEHRKHPVFSASKPTSTPHVSELTIDHHNGKSKRSYVQIHMVIEEGENDSHLTNEECIQIAIQRLQEESLSKKQRSGSYTPPSSLRQTPAK